MARLLELNGWTPEAVRDAYLAASPTGDVKP